MMRPWWLYFLIGFAIPLVALEIAAALITVINFLR